MRSGACAALAVLLAATLAGSLGVPASGPDVVDDVAAVLGLPLVESQGAEEALVRSDPDGGRTIIVLVEDAVGGTYAYGPGVTTPVNVPQLREAGGYTQAWNKADGTPMFSIGVYARSDAGGIIRVPLAIVEGVGYTTAFVNEMASLYSDAIQQANLALPYAQEILLPELANHFASPPSEASVSSFQDRPLIYVWTAHRTTPVGEAWSGMYLERTGSYTTGAAGVDFARKVAEMGTATRYNTDTVRTAGMYLEQTVRADESSHEQSNTYTAGAVAPTGVRVPLATVQLSDSRSGADYVRYPESQTTTAAVGVQRDREFIPLLGVSTEQSYHPNSHGREVLRITSTGAFVNGDYTPLLGMRYHSDRAEITPTALNLALAGLGSPSIGNFELDAGTFVDGEYVPIAGGVHRIAFRDAHYDYQSFIGVGAYSPLGFVPVAVATYDGTAPALDWVVLYNQGNAAGHEWIAATGTQAAGDYMPVAGIKAIGAAPLGQRDQQQEFQLGLFAANYHTFVPVASVAFDGDRTPYSHGLAVAGGGTLGAEAGDFDVRAGTYADGQYIGLAGLAFRSDHTDDAETWIIAGAYVNNVFTPLAGLHYAGEEGFLGTLNFINVLDDDQYSMTEVGVFVGDDFVPLVRVENDDHSMKITPAP